MASRRFTMEIEDIDGAIDAVRRAARANDLEFRGNNRAGTLERAGAEIRYTVRDHTVTITVEDSFRSVAAGWNAARMEREVKDWLRPYQRRR
jgi:hypothetical protein